MEMQIAIFHMAINLFSGQNSRILRMPCPATGWHPNGLMSAAKHLIDGQEDYGGEVSLAPKKNSSQNANLTIYVYKNI